MSKFYFKLKTNPTIKSLTVGNFHRSYRLAYELFKIMIPIIIFVKILEELSLIEYISKIFAPIMNLVGLPGEMGLVFATSIFTNIYSALVVFYEIYEKNPNSFSVAQANILAILILLGHNYLIELKVSQKIGVKIRFLLIWKLIACFFCGWLLNYFFTFFSLYQETLHIQWIPEQKAVLTYPEWILEEIVTLFIIFLIIYFLLVLIDILKMSRVDRILGFVLSPLLNLIGVAEKAKNVIMVGLFLGLSFGGILILKELKEAEGTFSMKDIIGSVLFLNICHAIVEDTILVLLLKTDFHIVFTYRIVFSILFTAFTLFCIYLLPKNKIKSLLLHS